MTSDEGVALLTTASPPDYSSRGATLQTPSSENVMNRRVNETILKTVPGLRKTFFGKVSHEDNIFTTIRFGAILISTIITCSSCLLLILAALYALKFCNIGLSERMYSMDDEDAWRIVTTLRQPDVEVGEGRVE
ncbi:hypothetical protein QYM36_013138 [Artemia franciscana]|uniref:Uncharacterized protein n=1 Tax=Artemia franciscana TaxID=6661 RepID=A0AA88HKM9_ARTSF|nr:hypothetical protein QYM36_013138 [Artemia franciscana]